MRIYVDEDLLIITEHDGLKIEWLKFKKPTWWKYNTEMLFFETNEYWAQLSPSEATGLFETYRRINDLFHGRRDLMQLTAELQTLMVPLMDEFHPFDRVSAVMKTLPLSYPDNVDEVFNSDLERKRRELTYIKSEYYDLAVMTVALRAVLPIWNMFRKEQSPTDGDKVYADIDAMRILKLTDFRYSAPMVRLEELVTGAYLNITSKTDRSPELSSSASGPGSQAIPFYIFASVLCNRLIYTPVNITDSNINLVTAIYTRINQDCNQMPDYFKQSVQKRSDTRMGGEDDDKIGYLESYAARQPVSDEIYLANQHYLQLPKQVIETLDSAIPYSLVRVCIASAKDQDIDIESKDLYLVQWILSPLIMHRCVPEINRKAMINAMGICQAQLITWGYQEIAALLSIRRVEDEDLTSITNTPMISIDEKHRQLLNDIYPFGIPPRGNNNKNSKPVNVGITAIDEYCALLADCKWELCCSEELCSNLGKKTGPFYINENIKNLLAEMLDKVHEKAKLEYKKCTLLL